jgi:TetR/AcrR family transcriptional regulator
MAQVKKSRQIERSPDNAEVLTSRRERLSKERKLAILDAALLIFARSGLHGTSVDQIARAADVSKTNLFYYFASKQEIYVAVLQRLLEEWLAPLSELEVDKDPIQSLGDYIRRKIEFSRSNPEASRLFCLEIVQGAPLIKKELRTSLKRLVDSKAKVIQAWIDDGRMAPIDPYHLIFSIWAMTQHYADFAVQIEALVGGKLTQKTFFDATVDNVQRIILEGAQVRGRKPK